MQFHKIHLIGQDDLPSGHQWAVVEHDEQITLFITEDALTPRVLEEAWAGYRLLALPAPQRRSSVTSLRPSSRLGFPMTSGWQALAAARL